MANALDMFRAQLEAAEKAQARFAETAVVVTRVHDQLNRLAHDKDLRAVLQEERNWLESLQRTLSDVRSWREAERRRYWPGVIWRWAVAVVFAVASAAVAGAGYGWVTAPYVAELATLRTRAEFAAVVEHRMMAMTATERRQLDALMRWGVSPRRGEIGSSR